MSLTTRVGLLAGASALTLTGASFADNPTEAQNYEARIAELEATVAQLKGDDWLTEQRAEEIRGVVQDVLADADTRASLLQAGMTAGYDNGFVIGSSDGNFSLKLNGQLQTRFVFNNQDIQRGEGDEDSDSNRWGFENTRTKLIFSGNVVNPDWMYYIEADFARDGGDFNLDDAYIAYNYGNGWKVMMGQFKAPLLREELVHSMHQQAVERSLVNEWFTGGRTQGVAMDYLGDQFHFTGAFFQDGANGDNVPWHTYDVEWASGARVEILFSGNWDQFNDFASWKGEEMGFMLGGAFHYQQQEYGTASVDNEIEIWRATVDASIEFGGGNIFAAFVYGKLDNDVSGPAALDVEQIGFILQGGIFFTDDWEAFARYEFVDFDMSEVDDLNVITIGVNKYWAKHQLKWTTDLGFGLDGQPVSGAEVTGWRQDALGQDGQMVLRTQLQLTF
jgi:hypothetical protein